MRRSMNTAGDGITSDAPREADAEFQGWNEMARIGCGSQQGGYRLQAAAFLASFGLVFWMAEAVGAQVVKELPGQDRPANPVVQDIYSVGSMDGDDWELFSSSVEVAFDGHGNLFVMDVENSRIVVVAPDGTLLNEFGRAGGGPGEFLMPMGFTVTRDDEVVVLDLGHRGFQVFATDGTFLRSVPLDIELGMPANPFLADGMGGIVSGPGGLVMRSPEGEAPGPSIRRFALTEPSNPQVLYEPWTLPPPGEGAGATLEMAGGGSIQLSSMPLMRAFEPDVLVGVVPDGSLVVSDSTTWTLKLLSPDGTLRQVLRRPMEPLTVTEDIRDFERGRRLAELESQDGSRVRVMTAGGGGGSSSAATSDGVKRMMEQRIETMVFAEEVPVLGGLAVDDAGVIWVDRTAHPAQGGGAVDFVSAGGQYLGTLPRDAIRIPEAFGPGGLAAFVEEDELGVIRVEVKRIEGLRGGS
jgi:hypothetical protein